MKVKDLFGKVSPTPSQLVKKYKVSMEEVMTQLDAGIKIETEHTMDKDIAREIALDHLGEDLYYYEKLKTIEKQ